MTIAPYCRASEKSSNHGQQGFGEKMVPSEAGLRPQKNRMGAYRVFGGRAVLVAQTGSLPYRRLATGRAAAGLCRIEWVSVGPCRPPESGQRTASPRYGRLPIGATGPATSTGS